MTLLILFFLLLQGPRPIDDSYAVSVVRATTRGRSTINLFLIDRKDQKRFWDLESLPHPDMHYEIVRTDRSSVVLNYSNDYGFEGGFVKLFIDIPARKVVKRVEFTDASFGQISDAEIQRALGVSQETGRKLKMPFAPVPLPEELLQINLPQSTYAEFSRARPGRVRDGYGPKSTIKEKIEPFQVAGGRIWFGKSFYDGEGVTGIGGIGYVDRSTRKITLLRIPEVADWSISNLMIEGDTLWAGLVRHPEGADRSGGLLRHDLKSGRTQTYKVDDVIFRIARSQDGIYLPTSNGIYVLKNEKLTRYRVEPDINGKPTIISEQL